MPERSSFEVQFWGTRGSIPTPGPATAVYGGNTSCVEVRIGPHLLILDAGTGLRPLGLDLERRAAGEPIAADILVSHTHWDHIQGLPFFTPAYGPRNRFALHGPPGIDRTLERVIRGQMEPEYFPIEMNDMAAGITFHECVEPEFATDGITVRTHYLHHPALTLGYRLEHAGRAVVYATDHELFRRMYTTRGDSATMQKAAERHDADFAAFIAGADVYIAESQYTAAEYPARLGWGHSTVEDIAAIATEAGVKELWLFHHDPLRTDPDVDTLVAIARRVVAERGGRTVCLPAREGEIVTLAGA